MISRCSLYWRVSRLLRSMSKWRPLCRAITHCRLDPKVGLRFQQVLSTPKPAILTSEPAFHRHRRLHHFTAHEPVQRDFKLEGVGFQWTSKQNCPSRDRYWVRGTYTLIRYHQY